MAGLGIMGDRLGRHGDGTDGKTDDEAATREPA